MQHDQTGRMLEGQRRSSDDALACQLALSQRTERHFLHLTCAPSARQSRSLYVALRCAKSSKSVAKRQLKACGSRRGSCCRC